MSKSEYLYMFKVVLVGNSCVGKSSIVVRYADDQFSDVFLATIGVDFRFKAFVLNGENIKLQIWDTAGQQKFRTITSSYYRGAHALMIVFDITDLQSYVDATNYWYQQIKNTCPPQTQIVLVGNKCDLQNQRKVTLEKVYNFLSEHQEVKYIEVSAKTSEKIQQAFHLIASVLLESENKKQQNSPKKKNKKEKLTTKLNTKQNQQDQNSYSYPCCQG